MYKLEFESCGRSMRWYEWLVGLLLLALALGVRAEPVYKCVNVDADVVYQDLPCAAQQRGGAVKLAPTPAYAPSPHYAVERRASTTAVGGPRVRAAARETAYECRVSDGRLFYRLGNCPHSIAAATDAAVKAARGKGASARKGTAQVSSRRIPLDDACHEIHRAGAIGRNGHEFDEHISSYEHNLGRDPCK